MFFDLHTITRRDTTNIVAIIIGARASVSIFKYFVSGFYSFFFPPFFLPFFPSSFCLLHVYILTLPVNNKRLLHQEFNLFLFFSKVLYLGFVKNERGSWKEGDWRMVEKKDHIKNYYKIIGIDEGIEGKNHKFLGN